MISSDSQLLSTGLLLNLPAHDAQTLIWVQAYTHLKKSFSNNINACKIYTT